MSREYCNYLIDLLSPMGVLSAKPMFGCLGLYLRGQIFALVVDDTLYLKVGDKTRAEYKAAGSEPLCYEARGKVIALPYWQAPPELFDDTDTLCAWAEKSYQEALLAKSKKKK